MNKEKIINIITQYILSHDYIVFAYIFGSFIDEDKFNDIDIAVYLNREKSLDNILNLTVRLEKELDIDIDLIVLNDSKESLIYEASKGELICNKDDELRINFITQEWKKHWDQSFNRMALLEDTL